MGKLLDPILVTIAGPNGSGKTTVTEQLLRHDWCRGCHYINPDKIRYEMAALESLDPETDEMNLRAAKEADRQRESGLTSRANIAFETVFSSEAKLQFLYKAKAAGFFIRLFFVGTSDPSINIRRVAARKIKGGHGVPDGKVISRYYKSIALFSQAAKFVNRSYLYDNSIDIGPDTPPSYVPPIIFRTQDGTVVKAYQPYPQWTIPILGELRFAPGIPTPETSRQKLEMEL